MNSLIHSALRCSTRNCAFVLWDATRKNIIVSQPGNIRIANMNTMRASLMLLILCTAFSITGYAAPIYRLQHWTDTYVAPVYGGNIGPQGSPIDYTYYSYLDNGHNLSQVNASVDAGAIGIYDRAWNDTTYAPRRQEVVARFTFDVMFASTGNDSIDAMLNFDLSGDMLRAYDERSFLQSLSVQIGRVGYETNGGNYQETWDPNGLQVVSSASGLLSGFQADGTVQTLSTGFFQDIPVNQSVQFFIQMSTINSYSNVDPRIAFGDTLSLTSFGDVFSISGAGAGGITAVTSSDAGIIDNRYSLAAVPVPAAAWLFGSGLLGLLGMGSRKRAP